MSNEESIDGEFAAKLSELVESFAMLDVACDKVRGKGICDAVGVKCDASCKIYVKKDRMLKFFEECLKAIPVPTESSMTQIEPEKPKERVCPCCAKNPARPDSKYCDYCGGEL